MLFTCSSFFMTLGASLALGYMTVLVWNITPAGWFCEYGQAPEIKHTKKERSLQSYGKLFSLIFFAFISQSILLAIPLPMRLIHIFILFSLLQLSISDIKFQILQDEWILAIASIAPAVPGSLSSKLQACMLPILLFSLLSLIQKLRRMQPLLGMGDVKLMAALGLCFGVSNVWHIVCYAFLLSGAGAAFLLLRKKVTKKDRIAFGPFIAAAYVYFALSTVSI